jgi:succinate dehydrogenase hydrophobic anchor subunit
MQTRAVRSDTTFDYFMWMVTRVSGLGLILMVTTGLIGAILLGAFSQMDLPTLVRWSIMPNPNHLASTVIPAGTTAWVNGFWVILQVLIVVFGATHGLNGLRVVIEDFTGRTMLKPFLRGLIFALWLAFLMMAFFVIFG